MHTKTNYQLVALDLDGTLFNSQSQVSTENKSAIRQAAAHGIGFVISTGRPYTGLPLELMEELGICYAITANGAAVYKIPERECLLETGMPASLAADIVEELLNLNIHINLFIHGNAYMPSQCLEIIQNIDSLPAALREYMISTRTSVPDLPAFLREQQSDVQKLTLNFPQAEDGTFPERVKTIAILDHYPQISYLSGGYGNLEFTKAGVSKAKGLSFLCKHLDIPIDQTIACGDSENDLDILKAAGLGVAMANAPEDIRQKADDVTKSNDEHGVAAMLQKWLPDIFSV